MGQTLNGNTDTSATNGFTPGWPFPATGVLTAGGPMPAKVTDQKADLTGVPRTVPQPIFNQDPPVAGKGKPILVTGSSGSTGTDSDHNRTVVGQVPNGPAFSNP